MYNQNPDHKSTGSAGAPPPVSPRISFSSDFVAGSQVRPPASYRDAPVSDFEFSVNNFPAMSADELFFKGRLLPLKEGGGGGSNRTTTLRDELENEDGDEFCLRPPKNPVPARWRGFLGLRKSHIGSKKPEKMGEKKSPFLQDASQCSTNPQEISD